MTTTPSDITIQRMLALVKAALHGTAPDENLFASAGEAEWTEVFKLAAGQGVTVLSLNGAMQLPKELQPPHTLKLRWIAGVEAIERRYRHCLEAAEELAAYFRENNIRMMVFKGIALARLYPAPESREFGDIDIFLCGKSKEGDVLLKRIVGKKPLSSKKHTDFSYKGILIENHHTFLNPEHQRNRVLEKRLMTILDKAGMTDTTDFTAPDLQNGTLLFPPPDFDALFVMLHLLGHWSTKIPLRFLCDLTMIFTAYKGKIDFSLYHDALSEAGLLKLADAFISLSVKYLGLNTEYAPPHQSDLSLENRIWNDLLKPEVPPLSMEERTLFNIFIHKIRLLRSRYWKSELVYPGYFGKKILSSTLFHLRHPETIRK